MWRVEEKDLCNQEDNSVCNFLKGTGLYAQLPIDLFCLHCFLIYFVCMCVLQDAKLHNSGILPELKLKCLITSADLWNMNGKGRYFLDLPKKKGACHWTMWSLPTLQARKAHGGGANNSPVFSSRVFGVLERLMMSTRGPSTMVTEACMSAPAVNTKLTHKLFKIPPNTASTNAMK